VRFVLPDALAGHPDITTLTSGAFALGYRGCGGEYVAPDGWRLTEVVQTVLHDEQRRGGEDCRRCCGESALNPDILAVLMVSPDRMSLRHLSAYTKHLADNHQKTNRYDIAFWKKVIYPLAALVMVALALAVCRRTLPGRLVSAQDLFRSHGRHPVSHAQRLVLQSRGDQQLVTAAQRGNAIGVVPAGGGDMIWWVERR
jgi:hypothetical protein